MGGGKSSTTTQTVSIPPEVLARYRAVNARAEQVAAQPFKRYEGQFVAGINPTQQAGITGTMQAAGMAQPYFDQAGQMIQAGSRAVGPLTARDIARYENPYIQSVVDPTRQSLQQQQGQERAVQQAQAIRSGGFGGDRAGLERANLARQQALGMAQAISPLYAQGYQQAVQTAMGQQGIRQQDLQRMLAAGQQYAGIGSGAQAAALQAAQAQIGAGTLEQQTQQADLTARYQQFLQERGYPFQVAQFLANIAMGTGALSGSTTTTQQPSSFFSDERVKENIKPIGETFDGQTIYKYNYKGEPATQIGLIAQEVEKKHPEAVGSEHGIKTVDYDRATEHAGGLGKALASMGGAVFEPGEYSRGGFAPGGLVDPNDIQAILAMNKRAMGKFGIGGIFGQDAEATPGAGGIVPTDRVQIPRLITAGSPPQQRPSGLQQGMQAMGQVSDLGEKVEKFGTMGKKALFGSEGEGGKPGSKGLFGAEGSSDKAGYLTNLFKSEDIPSAARGGGIRPHYALQGAVPVKPINPYDPSKDQTDYFPKEVLEDADSGRKLDTPGSSSGGGGGGSGLSNLASAVGAAGTIATGISKIAPMVLAMFGGSDARMKENIEPIGKTYDGQNIYRYNFKGDDATRMGLMAQEVLDHKPEAVAQRRDGMLMLDYDRATEEAVPHRGGVMPRDGLLRGGVPSDMSDEELAIRTIASEASGKSPEEARGIAAVIENRLKSGKFGGSYRDVVLAPNQFEPWSNPEGKNYPLRYTPDSPQYKLAQEAFAQRADDPTGGALHFWAPQAQAALGRKPPSWDTEDATQLGATRFVRGVDTGAPRTAQPRPTSEPGVKPTEDSILSAPRKFGSNEPQSWGNFLTSKQFVVPFLSGLGAMASSPSRYLGSAILQGLGAGAESYANLEKQQAEVKQRGALTGYTEAQTREQEAATSRGNVFERNGRLIVQYIDPKTGKYVTIDGAEYLRMPKDQRPSLDARDVERIKADALRRGEAPPSEAAQPGGVKPTAPGAATTTEATQTGLSGAPKPPGAPSEGGIIPSEPISTPALTVIAPDKSGLDAASREAREIESMTFKDDRDKVIETNKALVNQAITTRDSAFALTPGLNDVAKPLAALGAGEQIAPGAFAKLQYLIVDKFNGLIGALGLPKDLEIAPGAQTQYQLAEKASAALREAKQRSSDIRAVQALEELEKSIADPSKTKEAAAEILASAYIDKQRMADQGMYTLKYSRSQPITVARGASEEFKRQYSDERYLAEKAAIKKMLLDNINGVPIVSYLLQQKDPRMDPKVASRITPQSINEMYGADVSRYFLNSAQ